MVNVVSLLLTKHAQQPRADIGEEAFWTTMGEEYARKLFAGVDRHLTLPHQNYLVTDSPELAPVGVTVLPAMERTVGGGWWGKLAIFSPWGIQRGQKTLYLDLDNVVCGPLDAFFQMDPKPILMTEDGYSPGLPNGSTLLYYPEKMTWLLDEYLRHPWLTQTKYSTWPQASDQAFIAAEVTRRFGPPRFMQNFLPPGTILNARTDIEQGADYTKASLVVGSWHPKPHESSQRFYVEHWI